MSRCRILFLSLAASAMLCGQSITVQGDVFSSDGSRLDGATVAIADTFTFVAVTGSGTDTGKCAVTIPLGTYEITVKKDGYRSQPNL